MTLNNPTDDELDAAFAEKVAGWTYIQFHDGVCPHIKHWKNNNGEHTSLYTKGNFTQSADAVLPWLEKWHDFDCEVRDMRIYRTADPNHWVVILRTREDRGDSWCEKLIGEGAFARAAVIALLRVHGVEITFQCPEQK